MSHADLKSALLKLCLEYAEKRIHTAHTALNEAQAGANEESKSTAGDKHDTSRAMMQIAVEQASKQLAEAQKIKEELDRIDLSKKSDVVSKGSLVKTSAGNYFVAISAGKLEVQNEHYFAVSVSSPILQAMKGLAKGDRFMLNGKSVQIVEVY